MDKTLLESLSWPSAVPMLHTVVTVPAV
ncbi:hypothetical protein A2U01_0087586, partial [Trifolium medium]|nr:hypothetical protein [Trifolium medium]